MVWSNDDSVNFTEKPWNGALNKGMASPIGDLIFSKYI